MLTGSGEKQRDGEAYGERFVREIAHEIFKQVQAQGEHICIHAQDWGETKATLRDTKGLAISTDLKVDAILVELSQMRTERRIAYGVIGFIGAMVGALVVKYVGG